MNRIASVLARFAPGWLVRRVRAGRLAGLTAMLLLCASSTASGASPSQGAPMYTGIQLHSLWGKPSYRQIRADLDLARASGSNTIRIDVGWSALEARRRNRLEGWYRSRLDAFMNGAAARGLKVIAVPLTTPCWASSAPVSLTQGCRGAWWNRGVDWYPPTRASYYADFVRWLTHRYRRQVTAVEIWNEPDNAQSLYWKGPDPAATYASLVKAAYPAAKQGNPNVLVLAGSLAGADLPFLRQLYRDGIRGYYDGLSVHPYSGPQAPNARLWPRESTRWSFAAGLASVHKTQLQAHDPTALWGTEFGWASGSAWNEVSPAKQAAYTVQALHLAGGMPYVQAAIVYALRDDGSDPSNWLDNLGLLSLTGEPKPAFFAISTGIGGPKMMARVVRSLAAGVAGIWSR